MALSWCENVPVLISILYNYWKSWAIFYHPKKD